MEEVLREILKSQAHVAAGMFALWLVLGAVAGAALGAAVLVLQLKSGALRLQWKGGLWLRVLSGVWLIAAGGFLGGSMGGCEGTLRGTEKIVRESQFRTEGLRRAGEAVAGSLVWIDLAMENHLTKKDLSLREDQVAAVDAFLKSGREFDLVVFQARLERAEEELLRKAVDAAGTGVRGKMGLAPGGMADSLMMGSLRLVVQHGVRKAVVEQMDKHGVKDAVDGLFGALSAAGKARGDSATAAMPELAEAIVDRSLIPLILTPARALARGPQLTSLLLMLGAFLLPPLGFWIGRKVEASKAAAPQVVVPPTGG